MINLRVYVLIVSFACAYSAVAQTTRTDSIQLSDKLFSEGVEFFKSERIYDAIPLFRKCDSVDVALNYRLPYAKMWLAHCLSGIGESFEASKVYPNYYAVTPIDRRLTTISDRQADIANSFFDRKEYKKAETIWKKVANIEKQNIGDTCFYYANTLFNLGMCQLCQEKTNEGLNNLIKAKNIYQLKSVKNNYFPVLSTLLNTIRQIYLSEGMKAQADSIAMEEARNLRDGVFVKIMENNPRQMWIDYYKSDSIYKEVLGEFNVERALLYDEWAQMIDMLLLISKDKEIPFLNKNIFNYSSVIDFYTISMYIWNQIPNHIYNEKYFETGLNLATMQLRNNQGTDCAETVYQAKRLLAAYKDKKDTLYIKCLKHMSDYYKRNNLPDSAFFYLQLGKTNYPTSMSREDQLYIDIIEEIAGFHLDREEDDIAFNLMIEAVNLKAQNEKERIDGHIKTYRTYIILYTLNKNPLKLIKYLKGHKDLIEKHYGKESEDYASDMRMLGEAYCSIGKYSEAIDASLFALDYYSNQNPVDSARILNCYKSLRSCYLYLGNDPKTDYYLKKYVDLSLKLNGQYNSGYISALVDLGIRVFYNNDTISAEKYLEDAVNIAGSMHIDSEETLQALVWYKWFMAEKSNNDTLEINNSIEFLERAIQEKERPIWDSVIIARTDAYSVLGNLYEMKKDWQKAANYYKKDMENTVRGMPILSSSFIRLARLYSKMNNKDSVEYYTLKAYNIERIHIQEEISNMTASERETFWKDNENMFSRTIPRHAFLCKNDTMSILAYNSALIYKGFLLSTDIEINKLISESGDSILIKLYSELHQEKEYLKLIKEGKVEARLTDVNQFERDLRKKESEIIIRSKPLGDFTRNMTMTWNDIEKKLKREDVAIEFTGFSMEGNVQYVAFVLRKGYKAPQMVPICTKKELKALKEEEFYTTAKLHELIWQPLNKHLNGCTTIYFTPEGFLYNIAIESVLDINGNRMSEKYQMFRLSSTRELAKSEGKVVSDSTVLYGGLKYALTEGDREAIKLNNHINMSSEVCFRDSPNLRNLREAMPTIQPLPGTLKEVEDIANIMMDNNLPVVLETGIKGTEESFKLLSGKKIKTIHLSTHGFYDSTDINTKDEDKEANSLSKSGLLMSGASDYLYRIAHTTEEEDGILTAKEISKMDFRGLNLVVLSACETALGDISSEGVSGLQRGFKKAGAQSLLMSLWKVDDKATCLLMTEFYNSWVKGVSKHKALEVAKQKVRSQKGWEDPKYWAAFILLDGLD